ncbi:MAG: hypothetical protein M3O90_07755 [Actinomycetota bacterium]|nr:hypothetical protein [Actinomycetota bacterium]
MSTGLIIAIVIVVLLLVALLVLMPRIRAKTQEKQAERELGRRRERVATENRDQAGERTHLAEQAEQKATIAQQAAERERAEARRLESEADMHDRGLADDELIEDHERDRLGPVAGTGVDTDRDADAEQGREDEQSTGGDKPAAYKPDA